MKYVEYIGYALLMVAILFAFDQPQLAPYLASVGAAGVAVTHFRKRYEGQNLRLRRLERIYHLAGAAYVVGAGLMFRTGNYWLIAFAIAVVLDLYTMFINGYESHKEKQ